MMELKPNEFCGVCGEGILYGYKTLCDTCKGKQEAKVKVKDVKAAFDSTTTDNFHIIRFMGSDRPLIIDAAKAKERHKAILQKYDIPIEARLEKQI